MADYTESIGLDAGEAIRELARFDRAISAANRAILKMQKLGDKDFLNFTPATASIKDYQKAAEKVGSTLNRTINSGKKSVNELTVSWETLGRVVQTQVLVRSLNLVRDLFFDSAKAAGEFQIQVARIQQIAGGASFEKITSEIQQLAIELGRPLAEVANATFEALQNDIGSFGETIEILRTQAAGLALVTGGTLGDAVNALSSTIKGFNLDFEQSNTLADQFFRTIDTGRVSLPELADSLGTVSQFAAQLGLTTQELFASISTITQSGTSASVAMTQLRNVLQKGIKPTEELQNILSDLGVNTFKDLVERAGGFKEALQEISSSVGGDATRISRAFNTIRGTAGVFNLLNNDGLEYDRILGEITNSAGDAARAVASIDGTAARDAAKQAAQLEVILTELGNDALALKNAATGIFLDFIPSAEAAKQGLLIVTSSAIGASAALFSLSTILATIAPVAILAGVALGGIFINTEINDYIKSLSEVQDKLGSLKGADLAIRIVDERTSKQLKDVTDEINKQVAAARDLGKEGAQAYRELQRESRIAADAIGKSGLGILDRFTSGTEDLLKEVDKQIDGINDRIKKDTAGIKDTQQAINDFNFDRSLKGLSDYNQAVKLIERSSSQAREALNEIGRAGIGDDAQAAAKAANDQALASAKTALAAAERTGNARLVARAENEIVGILAQQRFQLEQANKLRKETSETVLRDQRNELAKLTTDQKRQIEDVLDLFKEAGNENNLEKRARGFQEAGQKLNELAVGFENLAGADILKAFDLDQYAAQLGKATINGLNDVNVKWDNAINSLQEALNSKEFQAKVRVTQEANPADFSTPEVQTALLGNQKGDDVQRRIDQSEALKNILIEQEQAAKDVADQGARLSKNILEAKIAADELKLGSVFAPQLQAPLQTIGKSLTDIAQSIQGATDEELNAYGTKLAETLRTVFDVQAEGALGTIPDALLSKTANTIQTLQQAISDEFTKRASEAILKPETVSEAKRALETIGTEVKPIEVPVDTTSIDELKIRTDGVTTAADGAGIAISNIGPSATSVIGSVSSLSSTTGNLRGQAQAAEQAFRAMEQAAIAAARAAAAAASSSANSGSSPEFAYHGGQVSYRADGGLAGRGHDQIATMLDPKEMVVNSRSTKNFFADLQSINAGRAPASSPSGGSQTINIGDINVNASNQLPGQTAREVGISIQRELRRRTFKS